MTEFKLDNLPEQKEAQITQEDIFNSIEEYFTTKGRVRATTRIVSTDFEQGDSSLVVDAGNAVDMAPDIQKALDTLNERGGGTVYLKAGTYTVKTALTGYPSVSIQGISPSATIIDFVSTSANLSYAGTAVYTTGTITSITSGVNVTGSGTAWLANASAGQYLFIGTRHYKIAAVTSDTTLVLSEGYTDNITMPGAAYRIATAIVDVKLANFAVKSSTGTGITFTDAVQIQLDNVHSILTNKGFSFTNTSRLNIDRVLAASTTSNGYEFTNVGLSDWESVNSSAAGGHGFVLNNVKTLSGLMSSVSSTTDGFNLTDVDQAILIIEASGNGGQGMEMVSGCDDNNINGLFISNTSDGLKLTATSDRNTLKGIYKSNGGYGINIAASSCDDNTIDVPTFSSNSSGTYNDSGTNTNIVLTTGVNEIQFTAGENLTAADAVFIEDANTTSDVVSITTGGTVNSAFGQVAPSNNVKLAQTFSLASDASIESIKVYLKKSGSPSDNVLVSIQSTSGGDPSGTVIGSQLSLDGTTLTTSYVEYTFTYSTRPSLSASTTYAVVLERSGSTSDTDYYLWNADIANPYASGVSKFYRSSWNTDSGTDQTLVLTSRVTTAGQAYKADANVAGKFAGFIGFVKTTVTSGNTATITVAGKATGFSSLTPGTQYYLSDTAGAVSTSAGTNTRKVGIGTSATEMLVTNLW